MGIVIKQSIKATIHIYFGLVIGFATAIVVFPHILTPEQIGLLSILTQISLMIAQFGILGLPGIITYYFFYFKDEKSGHHGLPVIMTWGTLIGCVLSVLFLFFAKSWLLLKYSNPLFEQHYYQLITLTIFSICYFVLDSYYKSFYKIVLATFLKETLQRILLLAGLLLFFYHFCSFDFYVLIYSLAFVIPVLILLFAIIKDGCFPWKTDWKFLTPSLRAGMFSVGLFNIISSLSSYSNNVIDNIMVGSIGGLKAGGIYGTTILFGSLVSIPSRTVKKITSTLTAEYCKEGDLSKIYEICNKSATNLYIIGLMLFLGIWVNVDNIFTILPSEYSAGKWAILFACITNMMEMITAGVGSAISTSKHYKVQIYLSFILIGLMILTNYFFIPIFGLTGAAISTTLSFLIFNIIRQIYFVYRWKMQPYRIDLLYTTLIGLLTFVIIYQIPTIKYFVVDIILRSILVIILFGGTVYFFKISNEINNTTNAYLMKIPLIRRLMK